MNILIVMSVLCLTYMVASLIINLKLKQRINKLTELNTELQKENNRMLLAKVNGTGYAIPDIMEVFSKHINDTWESGNNIEDKLDLENLFIATTGLAGETGEFIDVIKKSVRDGRLRKYEFIDEASDVLFYFVRLLNTYGITHKQVIKHQIAKSKVKRRNKKELHMYLPVGEFSDGVYVPPK